MSDVRYNTGKSLQWKGSIILFIFTFIAAALQLLSIPWWLGKILPREKFPKVITEVWLLIILLTQIIILMNWDGSCTSFQSGSYLLAIFFLLDSLSATLRDVFLSPNVHEGKIIVYDIQRWLALTLVSIIQVVFSFGIVILAYANKFNTTVSDPLTAIYISAVTFFTLGFGDYYGAHSASQIIVLCEMAFFLLFVALKLPIAISAIKVELYKDAN